MHSRNTVGVMVTGGAEAAARVGTVSRTVVTGKDTGIMAGDTETADPDHPGETDTIQDDRDLHPRTKIAIAIGARDPEADLRGNVVMKEITAGLEQTEDANDAKYIFRMFSDIFISAIRERHRRYRPRDP